MDGTGFDQSHDPTKERVTRYLAVVDFGDPATWQPFIHRLLDLLASEVRRQKGAAGRRLETMDIIQDVLLSMVRYRDARQPTKTLTFQALMRALVKRRIIDRIRGARRTEAVQRKLADDHGGRAEKPSVGLTATVEEAYSEAMDRLEASPALALKAQHLRLRIGEGRTVSEIAQHFGTTPENVRYHLRTGGAAFLPILDECLAERIP